MPEGTGRDGAGLNRTTEQRLAALEEAIAALGDEVRTRRLVIARGDAGPRIVGEVGRGTAELRLETADGTRPRPAAVLYASSAPRGPSLDALGPAVGLQLWADGDAVVELDAWRDDPGGWIGRLHVEGGGAT